MRILFRISTIACFIVMMLPAKAQTSNSVIGVWKGIMRDSLSSFEYTIRITNLVNGVITGTAISGNQTLYCETNIKGSFNGNSLAVEETEILRTNYRNVKGVCLLGLKLTLSDKKLNGVFEPVTNINSCLPGIGTLSLAKNSDTLEMGPPVAPTIPAPKAILPPAPKPAPVYQDRQVTLIKEISIDAEEASIQIFDNGVIDGDQITLTDNNQEVFTKALLSTIPLKYTITNKETNIHLIAFVADNLGSIPPNTGLMVITANRQRWEIYFSSDFVKTSSVKIILRGKSVTK